MPGCQRWRERRDSYRPQGEPIDPGRYGVELIPGDGPARAFVEQHHYSGSYPAARVRVGLYRAQAWLAPELVGVAVFSVPCQPRVIGHYASGALDGVELGRLVLLDDVPANGESWFVARAFRALREAKPQIQAVVSYSDPVRRRTAEGLDVMPGHVGTVYQALGARYLGRGSPRTLLLDGRGQVLSGRALSKIRGLEVGWEYAARQLVAAGAPPRGWGEEPGIWLDRVLALGIWQRVRHPGNHVYLWTWGPARPALPGLAYPKRDASLPLDVTRPGERA